MNKTVTFGEVVMRLSPEGNKKISQSNRLEFYFGGTEMNVGASLANFGNEVKHITCVSDDIVGAAAISTMKKYGIDTGNVIKRNAPLGLYFLEVGAVMRSSTIAYNRAHSAFSEITPDMVDWEKVLDGCDWFHWTGITPAISEGAYQTLREGLKTAREKGITVTADPTYRKDLWNYGGDARKILAEMLGYSTIFIGGVNEINEILGTDHTGDKDGFVKAAKELLERIPSLTRVFDKVRHGGNASAQKISARAWNGKEYLRTEELEISHVVDRIGTGDAYAGGLIYGLQHFDDQKAIAFANAACALKHTIEGDVNLVSADEVMQVVEGHISGRIKR
ncbi:sugar kinase [Sinomicrobium weinanense]|uniref:Sugar kinase n=1 Tax=Sinomicrobium weinanense TaxID=2842200 RepID=A0A926JPZ7_9FLAO|nr:sugar kinase [Sinomicrobium weinanense]MBC9795162.1 sugar kinase [Sinomicrobium weinanense]MBU3121939.1 sugar kinase [Sinomicrobium weinanense]